MWILFQQQDLCLSGYLVRDACILVSLPKDSRQHNMKHTLQTVPNSLQLSSSPWLMRPSFHPMIVVNMKEFKERTEPECPYLVLNFLTYGRVKVTRTRVRTSRSVNVSWAWSKVMHVGPPQSWVLCLVYNYAMLTLHSSLNEKCRFTAKLRIFYYQLKIKLFTRLRWVSTPLRLTQIVTT